MTSADLAPGRGVSATWWYAFGSAIFFIVLLIFLSTIHLFANESSSGKIALFVAGSTVYLAAFSVITLRYRFVTSAHEASSRRGFIVLTLAGAVGAVMMGLATGSVTLALAMVGSMFCILPWFIGFRAKITGAFTLVLVICALLEQERLIAAADGGAANVVLMQLIYSIILPAATVVTLWWWDIVRELDRARMTESTLAATQERLRMASDVHDLQGHHLQVIALQLELAERLITRDPEAALEQVRAAQRSVDEARDGTKALATRFRGVPLPDELANAADLLRAAGIDVTLRIGEGAADAPSETLGPVVRESTTNILKHGAGGRAALSLERSGGDWVFSAQNDAVRDSDARSGAAAGPASEGDSGRGEGTVLERQNRGGGTGIKGMTTRVEAVGGSLVAERAGDLFALRARVPGRKER